MSNDSDKHIEVNELLPWYVNGTLDGDTGTLVSQHLELCEECRDDHDFLCNIDSAVNKTSPAPIVPQPPVKAFLANLDAANTPAQKRDYRPMWAIAASVVVGILIVVATSDNIEFFGENPKRFETATSTDSTVSMDYVLRIRFEPGTAVSDRNRIFDDLDGKDVGIDGDGFRLVASIPATSLGEAEEFTDAIKARPEVRSVEIVAVQLPVRNQQ